MVELYRPYYPIMVQLHGKRCIVIGGGKVGWRRARGLVGAGAAVTVISPEAVAELVKAAEAGTLAWERREYRHGDLAGAVLVFAATSAPSVNAAILEEAECMNVLANSADDASGGGFLVPSVVRRGRFTISVTTGGASPKLAKRIAGDLAAAYGEEYDVYTEALERLRHRIKNEVPDAAERNMKLEYLLDMNLLALIRSGSTVDSVERQAWTALASVR